MLRNEYKLYDNNRRAVETSINALVRDGVYWSRTVRCIAAFPFKRILSALLSPTARKSARKKVQTMSHGLTRTSRIYAPPTARSTKFTEIRITSTKSSFFNANEYSCVRKKNKSK